MGYIRQKMQIKGNKAVKDDVDVLIDSGANRTYIIKEVAEQICDIRFFDQPRDVILADGTIKVKAIGDCTFETQIDGKPVNDIMEVLDIPKTKNPEMYLAAQTLQNFNLRLVFIKKGKGIDHVDTSEYEAPSYLF